MVLASTRAVYVVYRKFTNGKTSKKSVGQVYGKDLEDAKKAFYSRYAINAKYEYIFEKE